MTLDEYLKTRIANELANAISASAAEISFWRHGKRDVPHSRCIGIESATGGAVTRKDLRPDDWMSFWPELADKDAA